MRLEKNMKLNLAVVLSALVMPICRVMATDAGSVGEFEGPFGRFIRVGTREKPIGIDRGNAGLEVVSGDVRLPIMDAEYDILTDTLVKFDGTSPAK